MLNIRIEKSTNLKAKPTDEKALGFGRIFTDHMALIDWNAEEGFKYAVAAAECNDGEKAYFFQEKIGDAYYYGDGWNIDIDKAEGLRWYKRSAANGYGGAIRTLEMLQRNGEI